MYTVTQTQAESSIQKHWLSGLDIYLFCNTVVLYLNGLHIAFHWKQYVLKWSQMSCSVRAKYQASNEKSLSLLRDLRDKFPHSVFPFFFCWRCSFSLFFCNVFEFHVDVTKRNTLMSAISIFKKHFFLNIFIQRPKVPKVSSSCLSISVSFALWRHRMDSPIPASTWHYGCPIFTTLPRRVNT